MVHRSRNATGQSSVGGVRALKCPACNIELGAWGEEMFCGKCGEMYTKEGKPIKRGPIQLPPLPKKKKYIPIVED